MPIRLLDRGRPQVDPARAHRAAATADDVEIVAEARRGSQVLPLIHQHAPDVCLLDVHMPEMDGLTCVERIRKSGSDVRVVISPPRASPSGREEALARGADAYISKSVDPVELADALRRAHGGEKFQLGTADQRSAGTTPPTDRNDDSAGRGARALESGDQP